MDFGKLFQSAEDAVYEVMVWLLLLPKTLLRSIFQPKWAINYVTEEFDPKKERDERFDEYLSPVLLWMMVAVIPLSLLVIFGKNIDANTPINFSKDFSDNLLPMTLYSMIIPFTYIVWMEAVNKRPVKKSTLKISFYKHCYALAPSQLLTALFIGLGFLSWIFWVVAAVMLPFYEGFIFQEELGVSYKKAFLYALVPQVLLLVLGFIILGIYGGSL